MRAKANTVVACRNCSRVRHNRGAGLCWTCRADPAVQQRFGVGAHGPKRQRAAPPECWACNAPCPLGTHVARAGGHRREIVLTGALMVEVYCPGCFAVWGWPPLAEVPISDGA